MLLQLGKCGWASLIESEKTAEEIHLGRGTSEV